MFDESEHHGVGVALARGHQPLRIGRPRPVAEHVHPALPAPFGPAHQPKPSTELAYRHAEQPRESALRQAIDRLCARLDVHPRIAAEVDDMAMMRLLARENVGLAVLPPIVVKDELAAGLLVEAEARPGLVESFYAITLKRRFPNPLLGDVLR